MCQFTSSLKNFDLDTDRQKVYWSEVRKFKLSSDSPNIVALQYDYNGPVYHLNLIHRLRRVHVLVNPRDIVLERLHADRLPVDWQKYNDLISLCRNGVIPKVHHVFYLLLPHKNPENE